MCDIFTERYIIEGVEIPNQEIYTKMIRFFDGLCVDKNEWYKIHPTKKLIHVLMDVFSQPEKETKLMNKINEYRILLPFCIIISLTMRCLPSSFHQKKLTSFIRLVFSLLNRHIIH